MIGAWNFWKFRITHKLYKYNKIHKVCRKCWDISASHCTFLQSYEYICSFELPNFLFQNSIIRSNHFYSLGKLGYLSCFHTAFDKLVKFNIRVANCSWILAKHRTVVVCANRKIILRVFDPEPKIYEFGKLEGRPQVNWFPRELLVHDWTKSSFRFFACRNAIGHSPRSGH